MYHLTNISLGVSFSNPRCMAKTPPRVPVPGLCMGVCSLLGHNAPGGLGKLRSGALWDLLYPGLVVGSSLSVWPELRHGHFVLLSYTPCRDHCLLLCYDHLQGQVIC